nr:unnamed protein product [Digitaria exilis]
MEPPAAKEAPPLPQPAAEEDGMLSATAAMAKEASVSFQGRRYSECALVLAKLLEMKEGDPKVHHNMAITESFLDGCPDPERLLKILGDVKKRSEELACASREQVDSVNGVGSNASSGSRGSGIVLPYSAAHNASTYGDEFDTTIITFNTAVILYHLHDYESALSVLDPLYRNIEPIDEDVIQYLERSFGVPNTTNPNENASIAQQQSAPPKPPAKSNTPPDSDSTVYGGGCENLSAGNFSDEPIEFESLYSSFDGHQNLGRPILNDVSRASADLAATAADLKVRLQIYKEHLVTASDIEDGNQGAVQGHKNSGQKSNVSTDSKIASGPTLANVNGEQKGTSLNATLQSSLALYDEICRKENLKIRQAILGSLAFVELCLENPLRALSYAKSLQQLTDCSRMYVFLSHVYTAEALCALNKPKDAAEQLSVYMKEGNDIELPYKVENCEKTLVEKDSDGEDTVAPTVTKLTSEESQDSESLKPEEARAILYIDLGMTAAMQGEFEQADYMVNRGLAMLPNNPRAVLASIYVDLLQGKSQEAVVKLRHSRSVRFRPSSVAASS